MLKTIQIFFMGLIAASLLTACGPSEKEITQAKSLGFDSVEEMKAFNKRGYPDKNSYFDAVTRTPLYCFNGGREEYKKLCQGKKVVWVINIIEHLDNGRHRVEVFDLDSFGNRKTVETVDVSSTTNGSGPYLVEGIAGEPNTFYPDLDSASYIKRLDGEQFNTTLVELKKIVQMRYQAASALGFSSPAEMSELMTKGYKTKQDYLDAEKKRKDEYDAKKLEDDYAKYTNKKKQLDWIDQKVGGYKGVVACKVNFDLAELFMAARGGESDFLKDLYEKRNADLNLILVKHKKEDGLKQEEIDAFYKESTKDNPLAKRMDCFDIYEKSPK